MNYEDQIMKRGIAKRLEEVTAELKKDPCKEIADILIKEVATLHKMLRETGLQTEKDTAEEVLFGNDIPETANMIAKAFELVLIHASGKDSEEYQDLLKQCPTILINGYGSDQLVSDQIVTAILRLVHPHFNVNLRYPNGYKNEVDEEAKIDLIFEATTKAAKLLQLAPVFFNHQTLTRSDLEELFTEQSQEFYKISSRQEDSSLRCPTIEKVIGIEVKKLPDMSKATLPVVHTLEWRDLHKLKAAWEKNGST